MMSFWSKLWDSITSNDSYILWWAIIALVCGVISFVLSFVTKKIDYSTDKNKKSVEANYYILSIFYTVFITIISIFPLLGMYGTVKALLLLDMWSENEIDNSQKNFLSALTSTTWGIIFAIAFKVVNAIIITYIEDSIKKLSQYIKKEVGNEST